MKSTLKQTILVLALAGFIAPSIASAQDEQTATGVFTLPNVSTISGVAAPAPAPVSKAVSPITLVKPAIADKAVIAGGGGQGGMSQATGDAGIFQAAKIFNDPVFVIPPGFGSPAPGLSQK